MTPANTDGRSQIAIEQQPRTANTPSLWEEAWKKLPEDIRTHFHSILKLDETGNKGSGAAKQLLTIVAEIRGICEEQKLIDTIDDGKRSRGIIVRDLADKLISWVSKFVAVGDTLVQYDPGHAAIPWALVRFILQVCSISNYPACAGSDEFSQSRVQSYIKNAWWRLSATRSILGGSWCAALRTKNSISCRAQGRAITAN